MATIMFHSVGLQNHSWAARHISEPINGFEEKIRAIRQAGFESMTMREACERRTAARKAVCLTFDDGYLDNWVHVFPVLRKYGIKGTIYITPEFADPRDIIRPQVEPGEVTDSRHLAERCCAGFLSWAEMREMEKSGLVEIQSHGLTHTWYPSGPEIIDFWHPGAATEANPDSPVWMLWNRFPEFKPFYLTMAAEYETRIPYGAPVYANGKALAVGRFTPDEYAGRKLAEYVQAQGGEHFFSQPSWREVLHRAARQIMDEKRGGTGGAYESEREFEARLRDELSLSKSIIEKKLNKTVEGICWPGGGVTEEVVRIARELGYKYFTLPSAWKAAQASGKYSGMLPRISGMHQPMRWRGRCLGQATVREFIWNIERTDGSPLHRVLWRAALGGRIITSFLRTK